MQPPMQGASPWLEESADGEGGVIKKNFSSHGGEYSTVPEYVVAPQASKF